jgi:hypothetical protein
VAQCHFTFFWDVAQCHFTFFWDVGQCHFTFFWDVAQCHFTFFWDVVQCQIPFFWDVLKCHVSFFQNVAQRYFPEERRFQRQTILTPLHFASNYYYYYYYYIIINIIIILKAYTPLWTLASNTNFLQSLMYLIIACLFLLRGPTHFLFPSIAAAAIYFRTR